MRVAEGAQGAEVAMEEDEEVTLKERVAVYTQREAPDATGILMVTTQRVIWVPEGDAVGSSAFSLYYPAIVMHAISRDTSDFPSACIYMQLDGEQRFGGIATGANGAESAGVPMDTGSAVGEVNSHTSGNDDDDENNDDEGEADGNEAHEVRLVPVDVDESSGGLDGALERLFKALSEGAALNPDEDPSDEEDDAGFDMSGFYTAESFAEDGQPQALSMEDATPEQLAMLERYGAMLEASANVDGRFDDPEEDEPPARNGV
ncbi:hypothetical protein AB1Y20_009784 [Prymnesium parvum]|uniref:Methylosome subunit pICln n=1 Tax=Prymnesium parvum TaxID=97485 RepID=A0AB34K5H8_PRYPA|mmetsp:Transcript_15126/g.31878  ORF Transcript_15126/g.31878 Transcript_15126/m.31878 type:complete len:261 (-) Transcript_15126:242-1024(-)